MQSGPKKPRRTANACVACRQSKIKCSGTEPCANCQRRFMKCRFTDASHRVVVTERYLRELRKQARDNQGRHHWHRPSEVASASGDAVQDPVWTEAERPISEPRSFAPGEQHAPEREDQALSIWTNPFTQPSTIIQNTYQNRRTWIWLAPSSTWSFTARLKVMMTQKLGLGSPYNSLSYSDEETYSIQWKPYPVDSAPDITGLPPIDYALYLFDTVKFHLGQKYRFFDEDAFVAHIQEFYYGNALEKATRHRLWFVQFLLVLAFGKAFLSQSRGTKDPPGSKFFARAMSLMPDLATLWKDSLLAIEVLALAGLYLYSIDQRESAHVHVGQAIRIAQLEGLHTELPESELGARTLTRCRNLWWTLYIMDRHFSSSLGLPMTVQDSDITTLMDPPSTSSPRDTSFSLQVRLSHLLSFILTGVYKTAKTSIGTFLETTRSILHTLAGHAQEIEQIINLKFQNSVDTMPMGTRHIMLLYHQCVIVATRPLLLSVLKERLEDPDQSVEDWQTFFAHTTTLISTGIKSATKTLQILSDDEGVLEVFLPFDLEFTYGAAIHLTMANALFPHLAEEQDSTQEAYTILDEMIAKGNKVAEVRKKELLNLRQLFGELAIQVQERGLRTLKLPDWNVISVQPDSNNHQSHQNQVQTQNQEGSQSHVGNAQFPVTPSTNSEMTGPPVSRQGQASSIVSDPQMSCNVEFLDNIGISSYEFLSIIDQMGNPELSCGILDSGQGLSGGDTVESYP